MFLEARIKELKDGFPPVTIKDILALPCPLNNFKKIGDKARHDRMVQLVEAILAQHTQLAAVQGERDKALLQRQIEATDTEINRLVYDLHGLTENEIKVLEEAVSAKKL